MFNCDSVKHKTLYSGKYAAWCCANTPGLKIKFHFFIEMVTSEKHKFYQYQHNYALYSVIQPMINTLTKWRVLVKKNSSQDHSGRYRACCIDVRPNIAVNTWKQGFSYQLFVSRTIQHLTRCALVLFSPSPKTISSAENYSSSTKFPKTHRISTAHVPCTNLYKSAPSYSQCKWNPPFHVFY